MQRVFLVWNKIHPSVFTAVSILYLQASDAYLQMAIGNAPWPIGVTMVGIHARTGREKIFSKNVAHVMNDETQRKYLQGLKRLMTKCQQYFPTDPSRCVEYTRTELPS
jgi:pre-mRNA-splicing factor 18